MESEGEREEWRVRGEGRRVRGREGWRVRGRGGAESEGEGGGGE